MTSEIDLDAAGGTRFDEVLRARGKGRGNVGSQRVERKTEDELEVTG